MKATAGCLIGLVFSVTAGAEPLVEGRVLLPSGAPVPGAEVRLFDVSDLRTAPLATTTDEAGYFALPFGRSWVPVLPERFELGHNYPNPFNPSTVIPYQLPVSTRVRLEIFNILGQRVTTLVDGERPAGFHTARWDATNASGRAVAAGVYFYRLKGGGMHLTRSMVLIDGQAGIPSAVPGGPPAAVGKEEVEKNPIYGLTVSREGLVPYLDPAFRVEAGMAPVDIVVQASGAVLRAKVASGGILGDVDNNGRVDIFDALLVAVYSADPGLVMPNNGDITLGDVNRDGRTDLTDAYYIATYTVDPSDPTLPAGIGAASAQQPPATGPAASKLYWSDWGTDKIQRADLDGSNVEDLVTGAGLDGPDGLSLDLAGGKIYWADAGTNKIQRADLDGSNVEDLVTGLGIPYGLALHVAGGKMYWTTRQSSKIQRANLDGSGVEDLVTSGLTFPGALALDAAGGKMYWTNPGATKIQRANLSGSNVEDLVTSGLSSPTGLALDAAGGKIYWTDRGTDKIQRANLSGSNVEDLVTSGLSSPNGLALDAAGGKIYWTDAGTNKVQRANLNGSGVEDLLTSADGLVDPSGIAVGATAQTGSGGGGGGTSSAPDLVVEAPTVSTSSPSAGASFTLRATVRNQGSARSGSTTLRYYRSTDATVSTGDTQVGTDLVSSLSANRTSSESISLRAPSSQGTYYYGACVESVSGESNTGNNCSAAVTVTVGAAPAPDLVVEAPTVSTSSPTAGASFTLRTRVRNQGSARSGSTTLRYYRSTDATVSTSDTEVGTDRVSSLSASRTSSESISLRAPSSQGTYYYGACVESVSGESNTGNNCSAAVTLTVGAAPAPDLVVEAPTVSTSSPSAGASFTLRTRVRNQGSGRSASTTLRYYRSTDATVSTSDTEVGTDRVSSLSASRTGSESISLRAPASQGTYYYGACVESVSGESNTGNNCSAAVTLTVGAAPAPDLVVDAPTVSTSSPSAGASFTLRATVRNQGAARSGSTTLRYYRSTDATVSTGDTQVGTDLVSSLSANRTSSESISLRAPSSAGTYYYGACVESVTGETNTGNNCSAAVTVTVPGAVTPPTPQPSGTKLYWSDWGTDKIQRADLDGTNVEDLVTSAGLDGPDGLSLDLAGGKIYWADAGTNKIQRANLDGSGAEDLVTGLGIPYGLALHVAGGKMYWTNRQTNKIQRANLDGSGVEDLVTSGLTFPGALALDAAGGKMYWTNPGVAKIQRANLDGSGVEDLVTSGLSSPTGLALDVAGGKMYWTDRGTDKIQRANLSGSGVEDLVTSGLNSPNGLALDAAGGKIYWTDAGTNKVQRANFNGSGVEDLLTSTDGLVDPSGIAIGGTAQTGSGGGGGGGTSSAPDLVVDAPTVSTGSPTAGASFTLRATVRNQGTARSPSTTLRYYQSTDASISTSDTEVGTDLVSTLSASRTSSESIFISAPSNAGTYYYGACVESVSGETDTGNNCSSAVTVTVGAAPAPDLVVDAPTVSTGSPTAGASFTLRATVRNQGTGRSSSTTLRYYRSTDATVSTGDTEVGTDPVSTLSASRTSSESISLRAPSNSGTYYYGACVESVSGETNTGNNCSSAVTVTVGAAPAPDIVVGTPRANPSTPTAGASFILSVTVENQGSGQAAATTLRFYRSTDATISSSDTQLDTDSVPVLGTGGGYIANTNPTAPSSAGTYYYGACVASVSGETNTGNNCSPAVTVTVGAAPAPDLVVDAPTVSTSSPTAGASFTLSATVRNQGNGQSGSTTLRYYRSTDATVSTGDTEVGSDAVGGLSASGTSAESISLTAPSSAGTYYYGACAGSVSGETNTGNNCSSAVTVTVSATVTQPQPTGASKLYWSDWGTDKIQRADLDGSNVEDLVTTGLDGPDGLAVDAAGGKLYWTDAGTAKIQRADLDGSNVEDLVTSGLSIPYGLALDVSGGKIYWTDRQSSKIQRADLDGSNVEDLLTLAGLAFPAEIAVDPAGGKIYWANPGADKIQRADLDGSNLEDLVTSGLSSPNGVALDAAGGKVYWTDRGTDKIQRADLNGSNVEDLVTSGLSGPNGLDLDASGGKIYWTDAETDKLQRANLDGSGIEDLLTSSDGLVDPSGLALGAGSASGSSGSGTTYGVGEALPNVPTGSFVPARLSGGASLSSSGGTTTITFNNGGQMELQDGTTYTCIASGGCRVENGRVTMGLFE